ncbi:kinase-like domain-containing protein [Mycena vitilis]|nr:kinase-like domain-containing protein [Mycena vitilis]
MASSPNALVDRQRIVGGLNELEIFFRDHQVWLAENGYMLRPRYHPDWVPSWLGTDQLYYNCVDGDRNLGWALDAVRMQDDKTVVIKRLHKDRHPGSDSKYTELEIGKFFSALAEDPHSHCVPILDVLDVPDIEDCWIIVMPLLRDFNSPRFDTFGEAVDFLGQVFEGLKFMHDHNVAHRDCKSDNIMMDASAMFPDGYHPRDIKKKPDLSGKAKYYTRTERPPKYYLIDFGLSRQYPTRDPLPLDVPAGGGGMTVPEYSTQELCDPFAADVYHVGNMIRTTFIEGNAYDPKLRGFEFMSPLVEDMMDNDPTKRPTMEEVVGRFEVIKAGLSSWNLRSRVVKEDDFPFPIHRVVGHWVRRVGYILRRSPAVPRFR